MMPRIIAEWLPQQECYRVYTPDAPSDTIAYVDHTDSDLRNLCTWADHIGVTLDWEGSIE